MIYHVKDKEDNLIAVIDDSFRNGWYLTHYKNNGYNVIPQMED